ncbi:right-handed parallel beta-helix repeat-containing protein [Natronoflexus pectinivorans]|uniref:Parallel beta helix pectate lyase-like protein n=1 Tax=Natronoflexus pectinivorans TaxID=682526 RepID=A0A4R2GMF0_9BACT|nr:right-handed parallel beta-helix repeat-containing protein [Natronoflexus pectinivorans]TCO09589.1 parallel beta helix pectate lyase-like protein [Natronoflexus pectinivorans]
MKTILTKISRLLFLIIPAALISCGEPEVKETKQIHYGPIDTVYELPDVSGTIYFVSPDGNPESEGTTLENPTAIEVAISKVVSGDAIVLRGGTYRTGDLVFNQAITIQAYMDERPVLNGTLIANDWQQDGELLWATDWDYLFPAGPEDWWRREIFEETTPLHRFNNDGVFVDGQFLQSAGSKEEVTAETYYVDYENKKIYIGLNPEGRTIEITAFRKALYRPLYEVHGKQPDNKGPIIKGITFTQYPDTMVHIGGVGLAIDQHGRDVEGTYFENCVFSKNFRIAVFSISDNMVMRNCKFYDTNTEGLYVVASADVLIEHNIFRNNNIEKWTGFYPAAVKIFNQSHNATFRENLVTDHPNSNGVWYDVGNNNGVFVNNLVENVGSPNEPFRDEQVWPSSNGFFFEISNGAICAGNVFVNCNQAILILNSCDVEIYNNTFINSRASFGRTARGDDPDHFGWHPSTGPGVEERDGHVFVNNLMVFENDYVFPMIQLWQPAELCQRLPDSPIKYINNNVYVKKTSESGRLYLWSPYSNERCQTSFYSIEELNKEFPEFEADSRFYLSFRETIFEENYKISPQFPGTDAGVEIPEHIRAVTGWKSDAPFIGAKAFK